MKTRKKTSVPTVWAEWIRLFPRGNNLFWLIVAKKAKRLRLRRADVYKVGEIVNTMVPRALERPDLFMKKGV